MITENKYNLPVLVRPADTLLTVKGFDNPANDGPLYYTIKLSFPNVKFEIIDLKRREKNARLRHYSEFSVDDNIQNNFKTFETSIEIYYNIKSDYTQKELESAMLEMIIMCKIKIFEQNNVLKNALKINEDGISLLSSFNKEQSVLIEI